MQTNATSILVVDDSRTDAFFVDRLIRKAKENTVVSVFERPTDVLDYLARLAPAGPLPAACFVDLQMPDLSGREVAAWIRARPYLDNLPVVMLSGSDSADDVAWAKEIGVDCYLKKFPSVPEMQRILDCSQSYPARKSDPDRGFMLPCNLLSTLPEA